jgi:hypothetical protein
VFVGTIPSLGHPMGERGKFIGSKTKIFERVFSQEFRDLKLLLKFQVFVFFFNPSFPLEIGVNF